MAREVRTAGADVEARGVHAAIEGLRGKRMGDGDQRHVRLLAQRKAKAQRPVRGQVADEKVR